MADSTTLLLSDPAQQRSLPGLCIQVAVYVFHRIFSWCTNAPPLFNCCTSVLLVVCHLTAPSEFTMSQYNILEVPLGPHGPCRWLVWGTCYQPAGSLCPCCAVCLKQCLLYSKPHKLPAAAAWVMADAAVLMRAKSHTNPFSTSAPTCVAAKSSCSPKALKHSLTSRAPNKHCTSIQLSCCDTNTLRSHV